MNLGQAEGGSHVRRVQLGGLEVAILCLLVVLLLVIYLPQDEVKITFEKLDLAPKSLQIRVFRLSQ